VAILAVDLHMEALGPLLHNHAHSSWGVAQQLRTAGGPEGGRIE
jgi:hypothetical protein